MQFRWIEHSPLRRRGAHQLSGGAVCGCPSFHNRNVPPFLRIAANAIRPGVIAMSSEFFSAVSVQHLNVCFDASRALILLIIAGPESITAYAAIAVFLILTSFEWVRPDRRLRSSDEVDTALLILLSRSCQRQCRRQPHELSNRWAEADSVLCRSSCSLTALNP